MNAIAELNKKGISFTDDKPKYAYHAVPTRNGEADYSKLSSISGGRIAGVPIFFHQRIIKMVELYKFRYFKRGFQLYIEAEVSFSDKF